MNAESDNTSSASMSLKKTLEKHSVQQKISAKGSEKKTKIERKYNKPSGVNLITSSLGVKIYHKEDTSAPIIHVVIFFRNAGSSSQEKSKMGVPYLYINTAILESEKYTENQIEQKIRNLCSMLSCTANDNVISFSITFPKAVYNEAVNIFKEIICHPKFEKNNVANKQHQLVCAMQDYSNAATVINNFLPQLIFSKESIYSNGFFGSTEDLAKLSIQDIKKYKSQYLVKSNVEACIFGDISAEKAKILIDQLIEDLEKGTQSVDRVADEKPCITNMTKHFYSQGPQSTILFALNTESIKSPDRYKARVLLRILGENALFESKIMNRLRTQLGLIYSGWVQSVDYAHASYLLGYIQTDNKNVNKVIEEVKNIIKDLKTNGITPEELDFAKTNLAGTVLVNLRTSGTMCSFFSHAMIRNLGTDALNDFLNGIHEVNVDDVKKIAQNTLDENNITFVIIGGNEC